MLRVAIFFFVAMVACGWASPAVGAQGDDLAPAEEPRPYIAPPAWKSVEIGNFYFRRKNYAAALSRFKEAVQTDPNYAAAYLGLGKVYEKIGLKRKALEAYQQYLDELPSTKQAEEAKGVRESIARLEKGSGKPSTKAAKRN